MRILNPKELGLFVRQARVELGLTQADLARKTGTTQAWVSELESGKPRAEIGVVFRLLRALGVTVDLRARSRKASSPLDDPDDGIDIDSIADR